MSETDRKARIREYKETPRPAGVFRVRNVNSSTSFVGASKDVPGMLNRQRFQLECGSHPVKALQADWNALGPDSFEFETLDLLEPREEADYDPSEDLEVLRELWSARLMEGGEQLYSPQGRGNRMNQ